MLMLLKFYVGTVCIDVVQQKTQRETSQNEFVW